MKDMEYFVSLYECCSKRGNYLVQQKIWRYRRGVA